MHFITPSINSFIKRKRQINFGVALEDVLVAPYVAAMTSAPSGAQRAAIDKLIRTLRTSGTLAKLDRLYLLHSHHEQASRLNVINPAETALAAINAPTFTPYVGWLGDGATSYLEMPGAFSFTNSKYTLNDASFGCLVVATSGSGIRAMMGTTSGTFATLSVSSSSTGNVKINETNSDTLPSLGSRGAFWIVTRVGAAEKYVYRNKATGMTSVTASSTVANTTGCFCRAVAAYTADTFAMGFSGGGMTTTDRDVFNDAMTTYRAEYVA